MFPRTVRIAAAFIAAWAATASMAKPQAAGPDAGASDSATREYLSANGLLNRGLYDLAAAEYRKFLDAHADHEKAAVARYGLGVCLYRLNKLDEAAAELSKLHDKGGFEYEAEVAAILGQCHLAGGRHKQAAAAFDRLLAQQGNHALAATALAGLVEALYLGGDADAAAEKARDFAVRWPKDALAERVAFFGASAEMAGGKFDVAAKLLDPFLKRYPSGPFAAQAALALGQCLALCNQPAPASEAFARVVQRNDDRLMPDALLGLGQALLAQGKTELAADPLNRLVEKYPQSSAAAAATLARGRVFFEAKQFDAALRCFEEAEKAKLQPDAAAYWAAKCLLRLDKPIDAAGRLESAARSFADSPLAAEMSYDRAVALVRGGNASPAADVLTDFLRRFEKHALAADALHLLAALEHQERKFDDSAAHCRDFLARFGKHELSPAVQFLAAEDEYFAGRFEPAATAYREFLKRHANDPNAAAARLHLGMAYSKLERFDDAEPLLAAALKDGGNDPSTAAGYLALGDAQFRRGEWKRAEDLFSRFLQAGETQTGADDALLKVGLCRARQGQSHTALDAFDRLLKQFPGSAHVLQATFERGQALAAMGKPDEAAATFESVTASGQGSRFEPYAWNHLGLLALNLKDYPRAADMFARCLASKPDDETRGTAMDQRAQALLAAGSFADADAALRAFLAAFPKHASAGAARARLAICLSRQDRFQDALDFIGQAESHKSAEPLDAVLRQSLQYEKAWCLRKLGQDDEAARSYRELAKSDAADPHALLELAEIESAAKRWPAAIELLERIRADAAKAGDKFPPTVLAPALYRLGVCYYESGNFAAAVAAFDPFLDKFPDGPLAGSAGYFCGDAALKAGETELAARRLDAVVKKCADPEILAPAMLRLGDAQLALQHWPKAEQTFAAFLSRFPDSEFAYQARFGLGWSRENQQRYDEAIDAYRGVTDKHNGETAARAQFQIGECLFAQKKHEDAVRELLKVDILYAYPEWSAAALFEAGRCFEALAKAAEARTQYQVVVDKHEKSRWAGMARQRLEAMPRAAVPGHGG